MDFPESFWIAAATAAPIIALANVVTIGDSWAVPDLKGMAKRLSHAISQMEPLARRGARNLICATVLSGLNLLAQAFFLGNALICLAKRSSSLETATILGEVAGIIMLIITATLFAQASIIRTQIEEAARSIEEEARRHVAAEQTAEVVARILNTRENGRKLPDNKQKPRWWIWHR